MALKLNLLVKLNCIMIEETTMSFYLWYVHNLGQKRCLRILLLMQVKELARPGELTQNTSFDFEFNQVEKPYESYTGANVRLR